MSDARGAPPFDPQMMASLLLYVYCEGVFSSRKIAQACERNLSFLAIVGADRPDFRTLSDVRRVAHLQQAGFEQPKDAAGGVQ
jgi:transposase